LLAGDDRGFSLLELVLAIAALALTSLFILQLFMASANRNLRASDTDMALTRAISILEGVRQADSLELFLDMFPGTAMIEPGYMRLYMRYDKDWDYVRPDAQTDGFILLMELTISDALDVIAGVADGVYIGALYDVDVNVYTYDDVDDVLLHLHTMKYFYD
jgi:prepilin-type N-terminal cleavage/methylation domain-containing protein